MQKIDVGTIISSAISIGAKNALSVIGAVFLWLITLWIPYINVGTTIGLFGIMAKMGRGSAISPTEIFDARYRKQMGEFFLVMIFMSTGITIGYFFMFIPGIVIGLAWMLAPLLVLDRGVSPMKALQDSNDLMDGNKMSAFLATALIQIGGIALVFILSFIGGAIDVGIVSFLLGVVVFAIYLVMTTGLLGVAAYLYATLVDGQSSAEAPPAHGQVRSEGIQPSM